MFCRHFSQIFSANCNFSCNYCYCGLYWINSSTKFVIHNLQQQIQNTLLHPVVSNALLPANLNTEAFCLCFFFLWSHTFLSFTVCHFCLSFLLHKLLIISVKYDKYLLVHVLLSLFTIEF